MGKNYGEECGVAAIVIKNQEYKGKASEFLEMMEANLQHRGQQSAGIVTYDDSEKIKLKRYVGVGKVEDVFKSEDNSAHKKILDYYAGDRGIGHTRYSTSGISKEYGDFLIEAQPFLRPHGKIWKRFALAFNGNLANYKELAEDLEKNHEYVLDTNVDTELIMHNLSISMKKFEEIGKGKEPNLEDVVKDACRNFDGAYNVVFINGKGKVAVFRDFLGMRPLFYADTKDVFAVASESVALTNIKIKRDEIKEVRPGSLITFDSKMEEFNLFENSRNAACMFEPVYFMWDSSFHKRVNKHYTTVNSIRRRLGEELAKSEPLIEKIKEESEKYVIVPVPSTPIPAAEAMAEVLGIPIKGGIRKKEHIVGNSRGFIEKPNGRVKIMSNKYDVIYEVTKGMRVIVVEDSIVRGETSKIIAKLLREGGEAEEIHLRSTCPPIKAPCFYGIDFPTADELIASRFNSIEEAEREIAKINGFDSVHYQTLEGLLNALGMKENECCLACLTGKYPTPFGQKRFEETLKK